MVRAWNDFLGYARSHSGVAFMRKDEIARYALIGHVDHSENTNSGIAKRKVLKPGPAGYTEAVNWVERSQEPDQLITIGTEFPGAAAPVSLFEIPEVRWRWR